MTDDRGWLSDVVVINESKDIHVAGDVSLFRSLGEACRSLEPWWVVNEEGFAFTAAGERLALRVGPDRNVRAERRQADPEGQAIVRDWLRSYASYLLEMRRSHSGEQALLGALEERELLPETMEGLIAYIGFQWPPPPPPTWLVIGRFVLLVMLVFFAGIWSVWLIGWVL